MEQESISRALGCQARPWLQNMGVETFTVELPNVMRQIADIGFRGFETALAALPLDDPKRFAQWRADAGSLELAAAHVGGAWWEPDKRDSIPQLMEHVARLPLLGCHRLMVSVAHGVVELDDDGVGSIGGTLGKLAAAAATCGVEVALHNHAHEIADDARVLKRILEGALGTGLKLGVDLGWVAKADWNVVEFIDIFGPRLGYLHIRDVTTTGQTIGFVEVGKGRLNWTAIKESLDRASYSGWLVAESEFNDLWMGEDDPVATATLQYEGMRRLLAT